MEVAAAVSLWVSVPAWQFLANATPKPHCDTQTYLNGNDTQAFRHDDFFYKKCTAAAATLCLLDQTCKGLFSDHTGCRKLSCNDVDKNVITLTQKTQNQVDSPHIALPFPPTTSALRRKNLRPRVSCTRALRLGFTPKVAIAFHGINRAIQHTIDDIERRIFLPLQRACVAYDIFLHTYNVTHLHNPRNGEVNAKVNWRDLLSYISPKEYKVTDQSEFLKDLERGGIKKFTIHGANTSFFTAVDGRNGDKPVRNMLCSWNSQLEVTRLWERDATKYSAVIYARHDLLYLDDLDVEQVLRAEPNVIYSPFWHTFSKWKNGLGGMNDRFSYGVPDVMRAYGKRISMAAEFAEDHVLQSEMFTFWSMRRQNIYPSYSWMRAQRVRANGEVAAADVCLPWCEGVHSKCEKGCYHLVQKSAPPSKKCAYALLTRTSGRPFHLSRLMDEVYFAARRPIRCTILHVIGADNDASLVYTKALVRKQTRRMKHVVWQRRELHHRSVRSGRLSTKDLPLRSFAVRVGLHPLRNASNASYPFNLYVNELANYAKKLVADGRPLHLTVMDDDSSVYENFLEVITAGFASPESILTAWQCDYGDYRLYKRLPRLARLDHLASAKKVDMGLLLADIDALCYAIRSDYNPDWPDQRNGDFQSLSSVIQRIPLNNRVIIRNSLCEVNPYGKTLGKGGDIGRQDCYTCKKTWHSYPALKMSARATSPSDSRKQDHEYDIVVSMCNGNLDHIEGYREINGYKLRKLFVYAKCGKNVTLPRDVSYEILPNVGRCDHTYAYHMRKQYDALAPITIFLKDTVVVHQAGAPISPKAMLKLIHRSGFACGQKPYNWYSIWHDPRWLLNFSKSSYVTHSGSKLGYHDDALHFKSNMSNLREWLIKVAASPGGVTQENSFVKTKIQRPIPVCYGGVFAVAQSQIQRVPREIWKGIETALSRGDNIEEGHFMERSWALLLAPRIHARDARKLQCSSTILQDYTEGYKGTLQHCNCVGACDSSFAPQSFLSSTVGRIGEIEL